MSPGDGSGSARGRERRGHRRYQVAKLSGVLELAHPARVLDLSRSGVAVETAERLAPGRSYRLQLEQPNATTAWVTGRVVWCKLTGTVDAGEGETSPLFRAGLRFEQDLAEPAAELLDRLDEDARAGIDIRMQARYKLSDLASTLLLRDRATFEVRSLSRSGMAAEMEYRPRVGALLDFVLPLDEPVDLRGRVADVTAAAGDPRRFVVGIEFIGLYPRAQALLDHYLGRLLAGAGEPVSG